MKTHDNEPDAVYFLTELEIACGVTLELIQEQLPKVRYIAGRRVMVPWRLSPALASSTARHALGSSVELAGFNLFGYSIYRATQESENHS